MRARRLHFNLNDDLDEFQQFIHLYSIFLNQGEKNYCKRAIANHRLTVLLDGGLVREAATQKNNERILQLRCYRVQIPPEMLHRSHELFVTSLVSANLMIVANLFMMRVTNVSVTKSRSSSLINR